MAYSLDEYRHAYHECGHAMYTLRNGIVPNELTREEGVRHDMPFGEPKAKFFGYCDVEGLYDNGMIELYHFYMSGPAGEEIGEGIHFYDHRENLPELIEATMDYYTYEWVRTGVPVEDTTKNRNRFKDILLGILEERKAELRVDSAFPLLVEQLMETPTMTQSQIADFWLEITGERLESTRPV